MRFVDHQIEQVRLIGVAGITLIHPSAGPVAQGLLDQLPHGAIRLELGAEVEGFSQAISLRRQPLSQQQVTTQRFQPD